MSRARVVASLSVLGMALLALCVFTDAAFAQSAGSAGTFSCSGGRAVGSLYSSALSCPTMMNMNNIFSFVVCNMEQLSSNILGNMFCGMTDYLAPAVSAALVLAVVVFGISFTIGVTAATAREFQMFLLRIVFVWVFATQSDYLIGFGYRFFITGIAQSVQLSLIKAVSGGTTTDGFAVLDQVLGTMIQYATLTAGWATDAKSACTNAVFAVLALMMVALPPVALLGIGLIFKLMLLFVRAVFSYVYALVGIAFLMLLAPFFLSFSLFKPTRQFFDKWMGYLISFALQVIILFTFLGFMLLMQQKAAPLVQNLTKMIIPAQISNTQETTSFRFPWQYCTICQFEEGVASSATDPSSVLGGKTLQCKCDPVESAKQGKCVPLAIGPMSGVAPSLGTAEQSMLLKYTTSSLLALLVLIYVMQGLLDYLGLLAQNLSGGFGGANYAPQLGGGTTISGRTGIGAPGEGVLSRARAGFLDGFYDTSSKDGTPGSSDSISSTIRGVKEGVTAMVVGTRTNQPDGKGGVIRQGGFQDDFMNYLSDPNRLTDD